MEKKYFFHLSHETTHDQWVPLEARYLTAEQCDIIYQAGVLALRNTIYINPNQLKIEVGDGI